MLGLNYGIKGHAKGKVILEFSVEGRTFEVELSHRCIKGAPIEIFVRERGEEVYLGAVSIERLTEKLIRCLLCEEDELEREEALELFERDIELGALEALLVYAVRRLNAKDKA